MVAIKALTGIATQKRNAIVRCLDDLLCEGTISGYNWYTQPAICDRVVTLSHIHETEAYKTALLEDLEQQGYDPETLSGYFRDKGSSFRWDLDFNIRDSAGRLLPGLTVKRWQTGKSLELERYANNLREYQEFHGEQLIGTDSGWELNLPFRSKKELLRLVALFLQKGSMYLTDPEGNRPI